MRLLYLTDRISHRGGAQHHLLDVIRAMAEEHEVVVGAAAIDSEVHLPTAVETHKVGGLRSRKKSLDALQPLLQWADIVHLQNVMNPRAIEVASESPTVVTVQDHRMFCPGPGKTLPSAGPCSHTMNDSACALCIPDAERRNTQLALAEATQVAIKNADRLIVLSTYMARELENAGMGTPVVIPPPVPVGPARTRAGNGFLMAGRMVHLKAPEEAYTAWANADTGHPLRIAGLGASVSQMPEAELLGWMGREELRAAMAQARAVLFPARWQEPFGIVGAEALAMGTPVIATPTGGMSDWCTEGTVQVTGVASMAEAIRHLSEHDEYATALGHRGQRHIERLCSPSRVHAALHDVYTRLLHAR